MKIDRLIAILMVLLNVEKTSASLLAEKFEVSVRTIYRDLDTLLVAGIPVMTTQGYQGGVYIDEAFKLDKNFFSVNEIMHLLIGLKGIESAIDDHELKAALVKVKSMVPEDVSDELNDLIGQVSVDLLSWQGHGEIKDKLKLIKSALSGSFEVSFNYINKNNIHSRRSVEPYRLLHKESAWYFEGYCLEKNAFRMFKLSRILELEVTNRQFIKRAFTPRKNGSNGWVNDQLVFIDVEFNHSILETMVERCGEKQIESIGNSRYRAKMPIMEDAYSYSMLLSLGENIKCLGPQKYIDGLLTQLEKIRGIYA